MIGGDTMCDIYYPYYKIEKNFSGVPYNHIQNLCILSLFCDRILIPARDFLEMDCYKFDELQKNIELFNNNILYTRIPENSTLESYYQNIKVDNSRKKRIRIIKCKLFYKPEQIEFYDPNEQIYYFRETLSKFIKNYTKRHHNTKNINFIKKFINKKNYTKKDFDEFINKLREENKITQNTHTRLKKAANIFYFVAGTYQKNIRVCYDKVHEHKCIEKEIMQTVPEINKIVNPKYSPQEIINFLKKMNILKDDNDIKKLNEQIIINLRNEKCFKSFIREYEKNSKNKNQFERFFLKKKNAFLLIVKLKAIIISLFLTLITSFISYYVSRRLLLTLAISIIFWVLIYAVAYLWQKVWKNKIPFLDNIIYYIDPVSLFLSKLHSILSSQN